MPEVRKNNLSPFYERPSYVLLLTAIVVAICLSSWLLLRSGSVRDCPFPVEDCQ